LDRARTCAGGQRCHDRLPSELVGEDENADSGDRQDGCRLGCYRFLRSLTCRHAGDPRALVALRRGRLTGVGQRSGTPPRRRAHLGGL
jgi:hypothetical protein